MYLPAPLTNVPKTTSQMPVLKEVLFLFGKYDLFPFGSFILETVCDSDSLKEEICK